MKLWLESDPKPNKMKISSLFSEIRDGNVPKVKEKLSSTPTLVNEYLYGATPLLYSLECGCEEIALALCSTPGIDLELRDNLGVSPLERAIEARLYRVVAEIVRKIKVNNLNKLLIDASETLLIKSLKSDDQDVVVALIEGKF